MTKEIEMRSATASDAEAICTIYNAAIAERTSTFETEPRCAADLEARIDDARFPLLVCDGGEAIVGWARPRPLQHPPLLCRIGKCSVYVAAPARGRGVGTALTEALATSAEQSGFHKMIGKLFTDNVASVRLVERCGFQSVGVHCCHGQLDGSWRDVLVVERLLATSSSPS